LEAEEEARKLENRVFFSSLAEEEVSEAFEIGDRLSWTNYNQDHAI
jgi:hypothetical protein